MSATGCTSWLIVSPIVLDYEPLHVCVRSGLLGAAILALSFIKRPHKAERMPRVDSKPDEWRKVG